MPDPTLLIHLRPARRTVVLEVSGELDMETGPTVADTLDEVLADGWDDVVLDLRAITFADSTALHLLLGLAQRARDETRCIAVSRGARTVERLLSIAGLPDALPRVDVDRLPA